jgi:hypothetical protein
MPVRMPCVIVPCMFMALVCLGVIDLVWAGLAFGVAICLRLAGFSLGLAGVLLLWSFAFCVVQIDFLVRCRGRAKSGILVTCPKLPV